MAVTQATQLAEFSSGIGTAGAILEVDNVNNKIGIGTTNPQALLQVGDIIKMDGVSGVITATSFVGNVTGVSTGLTGTPDITVGNIVAAGATFSGVVTYEDVTNVDSLGIVTARTGLEVTANGLVINAGVSTFAADLSIADKIIHTGDTNTAIRFPSADTFTVETSGVERFRVDSTGDVGLVGIATATGLVVVAGSGIYAGHAGVVTAVSFDGNVTGNSSGTHTGAVDLNGGVLTLDADADTTITADTDDQIDIAFGGNDRITLSTGLIDLKNDGSQSQLRLYCEVSNAHYAALQAPAHSAFSGNITLTLPATTDTLVARTTTDTLTNKTLTDPSITDKIIHSGDTNTAIRFPAADTFTVETGGSERVRVNSSGFVGVNTDSPGRQLTVSGSSAEGVIQITNITSGGAAGNGFELLHFTSGETQLLNRENNAMRFDTNNTERVRITAAGLVGINTASPDRVLHVFSTNGTVAHFESGNANTISQIVFEGLGASAPPNLGATGNDLHFTTNNLERLRIDSSGRLLVGADASVQVAGSHPFVQHHGNKTTTNLAVAGYANNSGGSILALAASRSTTVGTPGTVVSNNDILGDIRFAGDDGTDINSIAAAIRGEVDGAPGSNDMPGRLIFATTADGAASATERVRIDSSGNMQVSTGQFTVGTTASSGIQMINDGTFGTINSAALTIRTNATTAMTVDTSQRLLIGTASSKVASGNFHTNLQVEGTSANAGIRVTRNTNTGDPGYIILSKSRGASVGSNTIVQNGDHLGRIRFAGADGTDHIPMGAQIEATVDGTPGANDMPGRLTFHTTSDGSDSPTERLRITSRGDFIFNNGMMIENVNINTTARNGTQNVDLADGMVHYFTSSSTGSWKPNFRVSSSVNLNGLMSTGDTASVTMIVNKSNTSHIATTIQIDGSDVTPEFLGGVHSDGGGNNTFDVYHYTIIKTGDGAFTVFASVNNYT